MLDGVVCYLKNETMKNQSYEMNRNFGVRPLIYCGMASLLFSAVVPALMIRLMQFFSH